MLEAYRQMSKWTPEERLELVAQVISGKSIQSVSAEAGIHSGQLYSWVRKYKIWGYNGLSSFKERAKN